MFSIHRRCGIVLALLLIPLIVAWGQTPRIDPAGIPGSLLLCGEGDISQTALNRFVDLAGGENAKIVVLVHRISEAEKKQFEPEMTKLTASCIEKKARAPMLISLADAKEALPKASGAWLFVESTLTWKKGLVQHDLPAEFRALLKRGGVIGTAGPGTNLLQFSGELNVLPALIDTDDSTTRKSTLDARLKASPELVGFQLQTGTAAQIKGRTISAVGNRKIAIHAGGRKIVLEDKIQADLTALRRSAYDWVHSYPPKKVEPPIVEKGTLVIVGGGGSPDGLYKKFVEYAGGEGKANIVIFATAAPDPLPKREFIAGLFKKAGARKATVLYGQTLAEVENKEFLDTLNEATGLWFDGGRQWRFVDCYENTKALPLMFDVLQRGGVIGGTSAGATIQGEYLCRGGIFHNFDIRYPGYERGLGFLKGVAIDQHFTQRKRQPEMTELMKVYPQFLGIGLDEATAIVVKGSIADVIGKGKAHFYDAKRKVKKGEPDYEALSAGGRYDLKERRVLAGEK